MTEPVVVAAMIGGVFTMAGSVLAIVISVLNRRDTAAQAGSSAAVATAQNSLIERLQADQRRNDEQTQGLRAELVEAMARVDALESSDGEKDARILVLTQWGTWSTEDPPRTPPAWRQEGGGLT